MFALPYYSITMIHSKLTKKYQATIPQDIRNHLNAKAGDTISFKIQDDQVIISKIESFDLEYHKSLQQTLTNEWLSESDSKAYDNL